MLQPSFRFLCKATTRACSRTTSYKSHLNALSAHTMRSFSSSVIPHNRKKDWERVHESIHAFEAEIEEVRDLLDGFVGSEGEAPSPVYAAIVNAGRGKLESWEQALKEVKVTKQKIEARSASALVSNASDADWEQLMQMTSMLDELRAEDQVADYESNDDDGNDEEADLVAMSDWLSMECKSPKYQEILQQVLEDDEVTDLQSFEVHLLDLVQEAVGTDPELKEIEKALLESVSKRLVDLEASEQEVDDAEYEDVEVLSEGDQVDPKSQSIADAFGDEGTKLNDLLQQVFVENERAGGDVASFHHRAVEAIRERAKDDPSYAAFEDLLAFDENEPQNQP